VGGEAHKRQGRSQRRSGARQRVARDGWEADARQDSRQIRAPARGSVEGTMGRRTGGLVGGRGGGGGGTRWRGRNGAGLTGRGVHDYGAPEDLPRKVWGPSGGCVSAAHGAMAGRQVGLDEWRHGRRGAGHPETIDEGNGRGTGSTEAVTRGGCGGRQSPPRGLSERREAG